MIDGENTLLPLVTFDVEHSWKALWKLCEPCVESRGAAMLQQSLDGIARTVAVERHYIDRDYRDTFSHYHSKKFSTPDSRTLRLHFFNREVRRDELLGGAAVQPAYCGYAVLRPTRPSCLGRTMIDPRRLPRLAGCLLRSCREEITLQGTALTVDAFPFISQDTDATVCAQSALWMLFRFFSTRYAHYREVRPFEITLLTKDYSLGRLFPTQGLTPWQMAEACRQVGFGPIVYTRQGFPDDFEHLLYTYVESGIPVLAATHEHVFVALGHTSDFTKVPPTDSRIRSSYFNSGFVINDDNWAPYQRLHSIPKVPRERGDARTVLVDVKTFIAPLPEKVFLAAEDQQKVAAQLLDDPVLGIDKNSPRLAGAQLVTRSFLTSGRSFKRRLLERAMGHPTVESIYRALPMPRFIWVTEIAEAGNFPNDILGEILWDATRNGHEVDGWIAVHYPEWLAVEIGSALNRAPEMRQFCLDNGRGYPPYRSNLEAL